MDVGHNATNILRGIEEDFVRTVGPYRMVARDIIESSERGAG